MERLDQRFWPTRYGPFVGLFRRSFADLPVDAAILGSRSSKDLDLLVIARQASSVAAIADTFTRELGDLVRRLDYDVIVRHDHRGWTTGDRPLLHVMFYPSYEHASSCELPSLLAYAHDRGEFILGDQDRLKPIADCYRHGSVRDVSARAMQMHRYADVAITSLIYLSTGSMIYSEAILFENLLYVLRFATTEGLVDRLDPDRKISFWDWPELIDAVEKCRLAPWIGELFRNREANPPTRSHLRSLYLTACNLTERGLDALLPAPAQRER